mmetsp:Transcript_19361/g.33489  ORF Transcript_19361/g.33489 Transcript_19361/m.33489 type:complete len:333 (-) Transcript_19361:2314-3312(-)
MQYRKAQRGPQIVQREVKQRGPFDFKHLRKGADDVGGAYVGPGQQCIAPLQLNDVVPLLNELQPGEDVLHPEGPLVQVLHEVIQDVVVVPKLEGLDHPLDHSQCAHRIHHVEHVAIEEQHHEKVQKLIGSEPLRGSVGHVVNGLPGLVERHGDAVRGMWPHLRTQDGAEEHREDQQTTHEVQPFVHQLRVRVKHVGEHSEAAVHHDEHNVARNVIPIQSQCCAKHCVTSDLQEDHLKPVQSRVVEGNDERAHAGGVDYGVEHRDEQVVVGDVMGLRVAQFGDDVMLQPGQQAELALDGALNAPGSGGTTERSRAVLGNVLVLVVVIQLQRWM